MRFSLPSLLLIVSVAPLSQGQTTLRYSFVPGTSFTQEWKHEQKLTVHLKGQATSTSVQFHSDVVWAVKKVGADKNIQLGLRFEKPRFTIEQGEKKIALSGDSAGEGDASTRVLRTWLHDLSRTEILCLVTPEGVIESVSLPEATLVRLKNVPQSETLTDLFSEPSLKRLIGQALPPLPAGPVEKGATWRQRVDAPHAFGKLVTDLNYTYLDGNPAKKHKVGIKSTVKLTPKAGAPATFKVKVNEADGQGLFDADLGRWAEWNLRQNVSLIEELGAITVEYELASNASIRAKN